VKAVLLFVFSIQSLFSQAIVFVHIGPTIPSYAIDAVKQARLFNPMIPIYFLGNRMALQRIPDIPALCVEAESLPREKNHEFYIRSCGNQGFWRYTTERFFYLFALMKKYQISDVVHLENDNLLYVNLDELLPVFKKFYSHQLGATFDHEERGIAGIMFISSLQPLEQFLNSILQQPRLNDMEQLARFKTRERGVHIDHLPITAPCYTADHPLISPHGYQGGLYPELYSNHYEEFHAIFDAAAMGQYLGGIDPVHGPVKPGFINESCVVNPSFFDYEWITDSEGRKVPYAIYKDEKIKIVNLHIHCKDLKKFASKEM
jgi:hypothetical protein